MHVNVYTNNLTPESPYPVIVWIHGGGFRYSPFIQVLNAQSLTFVCRTGSAGTDVYGPDYLVEQNVVLVTFNYRLHAFGFLSLDDPQLGIPGKIWQEMKNIFIFIFVIRKCGI